MSCTHKTGKPSTPMAGICQARPVATTPLFALSLRFIWTKILKQSICYHGLGQGCYYGSSARIAPMLDAGLRGSIGQAALSR